MQPSLPLDLPKSAICIDDAISFSWSVRVSKLTHNNWLEGSHQINPATFFWRNLLLWICLHFWAHTQGSLGRWSPRLGAKRGLRSGTSQIRSVVRISQTTKTICGVPVRKECHFQQVGAYSGATSIVKVSIFINIVIQHSKGTRISRDLEFGNSWFVAEHHYIKWGPWSCNLKLSVEATYLNGCPCRFMLELPNI